VYVPLIVAVKYCRKCKALEVLQGVNRTVVQLKLVVTDFPARRPRIRSHIESCEICGRRSSIKGSFLIASRSPLPILIPSDSFSIIIRASKIGDVASGLIVTAPNKN
jgi:hypothetical protein